MGAEIKATGACLMALAQFVCLAAAEARTPADNLFQLPASGDGLPDRPVTLEGGVRLDTDITYSSVVGFRRITLDLYRPKGDGPHPLVIYVHGGGWMISDSRQSGGALNFPIALARLAARGYTVASVEYRLGGEAPFPAAIDDVRTAVRFLKANAARYNINAHRVGIWGASAGAQLAGLEALDCGRRPTGEDKSNAEHSDCVSAAALWFGVYDFATLPANVVPKAVQVYLDCAKDKCPPERLAAASAAAHVDGKDPPVLLLHGAADTTIPFSQSEELASKLRQATVPVTFELIPGVGHGWANASRLANQPAALRAITLTFDFFDEHLKRGQQ